MRTGNGGIFGPALILAMVLVVPVALAQEAGVESDEPMPAVDTSATQAAPQLPEDVVRSTSGSRVMDSLELGRTEITGNQELPKVLYIVPWKKSDPGNLMGRPVNTLLDEVLAPLDREEFIRQVEYYKDLNGKE